MSRRRANSVIGALLCVLLALVGCAESAAPRAPVATGAVSSVSAVRVRSATIEYFPAGPVDPVVELRVYLENGHTRPTESTSILWDPVFARQFVFLRSEPEPWRVRIDETGWGSFDGSGVIRGQFATYRLWFAAGTYEPLEPRLKIIADGRSLVADTLAVAPHLRWQRPLAQQNAFERGPAAALAAPATLLHSGPRPTFFYAVTLALTLLGVTLTGALMAFRTTSH